IHILYPRCVLPGVHLPTSRGAQQGRKVQHAGRCDCGGGDGATLVVHPQLSVCLSDGGRQGFSGCPSPALCLSLRRRETGLL
ncbi:hypothetical protein NHX12_030079, partial [Muraenolepis orangiensis]